MISSRLRDFIENKLNLWYSEFIEVILVAENKLADMSTEFAIQILKLTEPQRRTRNDIRRN